MQKVDMRMPKAVNDLIVVLITPSVLSRIYWWPFFGVIGCCVWLRCQTFQIKRRLSFASSFLSVSFAQFAGVYFLVYLVTKSRFLFKLKSSLTPGLNIIIK